MCESVGTVTPAQVGWPFQIFSTPPLFPGLSDPVLQSFSQSYNSTVFFFFFETESHYVALLAWNSLWRLGWP